MSKSTVFLCPSCQEVIRSEGQAREDLTCGACGFKLGDENRPKPRPAPRVKTSLPGGALASSGVMRDAVGSGVAGKPSALPGKAAASGIKAKLPELKKADSDEEEKEAKAEKETILPDGTRQVKRRKKRRKEKNKTLYLFLGGWILVVILIVGFFQGGEFTKDEEEVPSDFTPEEIARKNRHSLLLKKHRVSALTVFQKFLQSNVNGGKLQLIDESAKVASSFGRFYTNESPIAVPEGLQLQSLEVVEFAEGKVTPGLEAIWKSGEGATMESLLLWDGNNWKVDWEHFVRYSTEPWGLFKLGAARSNEGIFRVFARMKETSNNEQTEVDFYGPARAGESDSKGIYGRKTPDGVVFPARGNLGTQFSRLWKSFLAKKPPYKTKFTDDDPRGMMRLTVRLAWEDGERGEKELVLREILEPSWYGSRVRDYYKKFPPKQSVIDTANALK